MPSLRRSFSSLSVRSSPYPSTTVLSSARTRTSQLYPRRASASATAERRVLADIEWWRVHDGQCDLDPQDPAHDEPHDEPRGMVTLSVAGGSLEPPQTPPSMYTFSLDSPQPVSDALAVFAIASYSPQGSRHGRDSGDSTPELSATPLEADHHGLPSLTLDDRFSFPSSLARVGGRQVHPLFGLRSISAPGPAHQFADMGGDSFSLDQNLFQ